MSIETDYHALLLAYAPLTALVSTRIAQDAVPNGMTGSLVVYSATHNEDKALDGTVLSDQVSLPTQCWAPDGVLAGQVADAVVAAIAAANPANDVTVLSRSTTFDPELGLDGVVLDVEWWV